MMTQNPYLQPLTTGRIITGAFRLYRDHLALLITVALIPHMVLLALEYLLLAPGAESPVLLGVFLLATIALNAVTLAAITVAVIHTILSEEPGVGVVYALTFRENLLGVVLAYLVTTLLVSLGFMMLLFPGLLVGGLFAPVIPIILIERRPVFVALSRSIALVRNNLPKAVAVFSFFILIAGILPLSLVVLPTGAGPFSPLLGAILGAVTLPLGFTANVLLYLSLRVGEEDYTLEELRVEMGHSPQA